MAGYLGTQYNMGDLGGSGMDMGSATNAAGSGAAGFAMGGPVGAGIGVLGSFLTQYMAQKAQAEENRKKALMEAAQNQGQQTSNAIGNMANWYGQVLR